MRNLILILSVVFSAACEAQQNRSGSRIGGPCEGCDALYEYRNKLLNNVDTLPEFVETTPKMVISGTVYKNDGKTPAEGVILYIYHTNRGGIYPTNETVKGRHGYIRGWVKTEKDGKYTFYTFRPGAYPGRGVPEHIHIFVKEPGKNEYYIDDYLFDDDPFLTESNRQRQQKRGGSGIVVPENRNGILYVNRDIILGMNVPDWVR